MFGIVSMMKRKVKPGRTMRKEEYLMKRILGCAVVLLFLGAVPLLAKSFDGNEYEKGKTLYEDKCDFCHGIRGDGKGPAAEPLLGHPVDFTGSRLWKEGGESVIEDTIKDGEGMMPAFTLEAGEIKAIIRYMSHTFNKEPGKNN
jgi:cytochrome c5